ncbi:MAG: 2-dehydro-3-deoxygalactonokinase [Clostridium sp.]|nr:2-dehydro-3-deoxygalactonokinase [Clostridium sp.]
MYVVYFDSGTTNTRAYLISQYRVERSTRKHIGAKKSALYSAREELIKSICQMYHELLIEENITEDQVAHIYLSGMISSASGIIEIAHIDVPVNKDKLKSRIVTFFEDRFFHRNLEIIPGVKAKHLREIQVDEIPERISMMRGEEIEIFGVMAINPCLQTGKVILLMPGSHTHAVLVENGVIQDIISNITGELYEAIVKNTILGASVMGNDEWKVSSQMVILGGKRVHESGLNQALYSLRVFDVFNLYSLNERRSYLEGVIMVGVMDAVTEMLKKWTGNSQETVNLAVVGDFIQEEIFRAFCENMYPEFVLKSLNRQDGIPFSVLGLLSLCEGK